MIQKSSSSNPNHFQDAQECSYVLSPHPPKYVMMMLLHKIAGNCRIYARNWISTKQHADKGLHPTMAKLFKSSSQSLMFENVYLAQGKFHSCDFWKIHSFKMKNPRCVGIHCPWNRVCTPTGLVAATNSHNWDHLISQSAQRLLPQQISLFVVCVHWALKKQDLLGSDTRRPLEMKRLNQERIRQQRLFIGFGNLGKKC